MRKIRARMKVGETGSGECGGSARGQKTEKRVAENAEDPRADKKRTIGRSEKSAENAEKIADLPLKNRGESQMLRIQQPWFFLSNLRRDSALQFLISGDLILLLAS